VKKKNKTALDNYGGFTIRRKLSKLGNGSFRLITTWMGGGRPQDEKNPGNRGREEIWETVFEREFVKRKGFQSSPTYSKSRLFRKSLDKDLEWECNRKGWLAVQ